MTVEMGHEIERFLGSVQDKTLKCWCGQELDCVGFEGYPDHDGGLMDASGKKWWVYLHCDKCGYDWSFWKVERRAKKEMMVEIGA